MTNGIEMQNALEKAFIEAIKDNAASFTLDWSDAVDDIYQGFVRDLKADVEAELRIGEDGRGEAGRELFGVVWFSDNNSAEIVGKREPLSDMLLLVAEMYGKEDALAALELSLANFRAKLRLKDY